MEPQRRPRVVISVEPPILAHLLADLLGRAGVDDLTVRAPGEFDAAVVTIDFPDDVEAGVVIALPDRTGNAGMGTVRRGRRVQKVMINGVDTILELLDEHCPGERPRRTESAAG